MIFGRRLVQNGWVWAAAAVSLALQLLVVYVPAVARPFGTVVPTPHSLAVVAVASALPLLVAQLAKALHRRR